MELLTILHDAVAAAAAGVTSNHLPQFSRVRAVLLGSHAVHHQKPRLGHAVHHGNDSRRICQRRRQYIPRYGM